MKEENADIIRQIVRGRYARAAGGAGCGCQPQSPSPCCGPAADLSRRAGELMADAALSVRIRRREDRREHSPQPGAVGRVAGGATLLAGEMRMLGRDWAGVGRQGSESAFVSEMKARSEDEQKHNPELPDEPPAPGAQREPRHARRMRLGAGTVGLRSKLARAARGRRPAAFVTSLLEHWRAFAGTAALRAVRPIRAGRAPGSASTAAILVARALVVTTGFGVGRSGIHSA